MLPTEIIPTERPTESQLTEKKHGCEGGGTGGPLEVLAASKGPVGRVAGRAARETALQARMGAAARAACGDCPLRQRASCARKERAFSPPASRGAGRHTSVYVEKNYTRRCAPNSNCHCQVFCPHSFNKLAMAGYRITPVLVFWT